MQRVNILDFRPLILLAMLVLAACGGGGGGGAGSSSNSESAAPVAPPAEPTPITFTDMEAARFLSQATFGPASSDIDSVSSKGPEAWLMEQLEIPASLHLEGVLAQFPEDGRFFDERGNALPELVYLASNSFWRTAIEAQDQLRQRMAFALSQILVISADSNLGRAPQTVAHYADILTEGAFGNYRDLLEKVTYSPAMAVYLTYLRNEKADNRTGRVPDENYARELLQLFTIGLVELNPDGSAVKDAQGGQVELFNNADITELAKVFTGLSWSGTGFRTQLARVPLNSFYSPLAMFDEYHSTEAKNFLDANIPAGTDGRASIDMALDAIFGNPNVGPFISRQLIQRFVTSAPTAAYVGRVARAFDEGSYTLPAGTRVGSDERGDLAAVIAAILFDTEARSDASGADSAFGKLREPVLRFTHWARAFNVNSADASNERALRATGRSEALAQHPYNAPSVFNFYRPGYIAAGSLTGAAGLTAPELQITNANSIVGYPNFLSLYAFGLSPKVDPRQPAAYVPDYSAEAALTGDPGLLVDHLDRLLTHGSLQADSRNRIINLLNSLPTASAADREQFVQVAVVLVMTTPEYIVLR